MERRKFTREFKREAVKLIQERGVTMVQASRDLGVHGTVLRRWVQECAADPQQAFPGQGQMKPEQAEIRTAPPGSHQAEGGAGHPKKSRGLLREGGAVKFAFIAKHRGIWPAGWLCEALGVSRGGFYAWLTRPPSHRARSDEALGAKVRASFLQSDRTYGARRVWHDLLAEGVKCGLHRIERLMRLHALRARPRRRRLPADAGERSPAVVSPNVLNRQFEAPATEPQMGRRLHVYLDERGLALCGGGRRSVLSPGRRLVHECDDDGATGHGCVGDGDLATRQAQDGDCITRIKAANTPANCSSGSWRIRVSPAA